MNSVILIIQIILSLVFITLVILQVKGTGFGRVWGGLSVSSSRRGLEGLVFKFTFVVAFLFICVSLAALTL